ncbi:MAG: aminotransferase class IV [Acidimicrobiales bacterium]
MRRRCAPPAHHRTRDHPRGVYCGAAGVLAPSGVSTFNVAIRTVWVDHEAATATYGTGGGIVWDSDPHDEWVETKVKTRVLDRACEPIGLIETMSWDPALGIANVDRHLERLTRSAEELGHTIDLPAVRALLDSIQGDEPQRVRLLALPDGELELTLAPLPRPACRPWRVALATTPVSSTDPALRHKTTQRHVYDHHRSQHPEADEVILWNERGEVTETTIGNIVIERNGWLVTPPLSSGLLPGTFRAELLAHDKIVEGVVTVDELATADALFMINAIRGWVPLELVR